MAGALGQHADYLKNWMSGILQWHREATRYTEAELRRPRIPATPPSSRTSWMAPSILATTKTFPPT